MNIPSSRITNRAGYRTDAAMKPEPSGRSIHNSYQLPREIAPNAQTDGAKMFDSSPHLTVFEGGPSHRMHTYNTRKSAIQSQDNLVDSLKRLSDVRLMLDQSHCPRYQKIKEQRLSMRQQQIS